MVKEDVTNEEMINILKLVKFDDIIEKNGLESF